MLLILIPCILIRVIENYFSKRTSIYIQKEVTLITSNYLSTVVANLLQIEPMSLVTYQYDNNEALTSILINNQEVNRYLVKASTTLSQQLEGNNLEERLKEISFPIGQLISPTLLASFGPNIKIKTILIDSYQADISSSLNEYGINNALFEIFLKINIEMIAMIPLKQENIKVETRICLLSQIIQGSVPRYYYNGNGEVLYIPED